ncbi:MAG TPA: antibiotic biosynthesis monooxygenase [Myxococcaceae bacterium]|nr:antibiotic biosynthesis monooxygenase [Myxococcaceae bacterium]
MASHQAVKVGLFVRLVARPGKEKELEALLRSGLPLVQDEPGTLQWYAVKFDAKTFAIFDTFSAEAGRDAHLAGRLAAALMAKAGELLVEAPNIEKHDILAAKV